MGGEDVVIGLAWLPSWAAATGPTTPASDVGGRGAEAAVVLSGLSTKGPVASRPPAAPPAPAKAAPPAGATPKRRDFGY